MQDILEKMPRIPMALLIFHRFTAVIANYEGNEVISTKQSPRAVS